MAKTTNLLQSDFTVSSYTNGYVCFCKKLPDSSTAYYWLKLYVDEGLEIFQITEILKPVSQDSSTLTKQVCSGSVYSFPNGDAASIMADTLQISHVLSAGLCDSVVLTDLHVLPAQQVIIQNVSVCKGGQYTFPDGSVSQNIHSDFSHYSSMISNGGCDSLIITNVICLPVIVTYDTVAACKGSLYTFADGYTVVNLQSTINHDCHLHTLSGCDSIVKTTLAVLLPVNNYQTRFICKGADFTFPDLTTLTNIQNDTTYLSYLLQMNGCDSLVYTSIKLYKAVSHVVQQKVCYLGDIILVNGQVISSLVQDTMIDVVLKFQAGCDSAYYHYELLADTLHTGSSHEQVCRHADHTFADGTSIRDILNDTMYVSNLKTQQNCDSFLTTYLKVQSLDTAVFQNKLHLQAHDSSQLYQWIDCNTGQLLTGENSSHFNGEPGKSYRLLISGQNGCSDTSSCYTLYTMQEGNTIETVHIYPNPADRLISIEFYKTIEDVQLRLLNTSGQVVKGFSFFKQRFVQMDVSDIAKGVYFMQISGDGINHYAKVLVQ
jgi:hypothetical protein